MGYKVSLLLTNSGFLRSPLPSCSRQKFAACLIIPWPPLRLSYIAPAPRKKRASRCSASTPLMRPCRTTNAKEEGLIRAKWLDLNAADEVGRLHAAAQVLTFPAHAVPLLTVAQKREGITRFPSQRCVP